MRKIILGALATLFLLASAFGAQAAPREEPGPGPNGSNEKGLCTAYFNGQKKGHEDGSPGPFGVLEEDAYEYDQENGADDGDENTSDDGENLPEEQGVASDVFEFCDRYGIMGNPEENGRFDCRDGEDRDSPARDTDGDDTDGDGAADGDDEIECFVNGTEDDEDPTPAP